MARYRDTSVFLIFKKERKKTMITLLAMILTQGAAEAAPPQSIARRLQALIPWGHSEGFTKTGAPCRLVFDTKRDPDPRKIEYARAQVMEEPSGSLADVEIFFDGYGGNVTGLASGRLVEARYDGKVLSARRSQGKVLVYAKDLSQEASCLVPARNR
jgi:hypothetical protein